MENPETKSKIQTAARETAESARKVGDKLRSFAGDAADSSRRWVRRSGEALSEGAEFATLQVKQSVVRRRLDRAYQELGRAVYAAHEKGEDAGPIVEIAEIRAALEQVKMAAGDLH